MAKMGVKKQQRGKQSTAKPRRSKIESGVPEPESDEDIWRKIWLGHGTLKHQVMKVLEAEGIKVDETHGNDPNGDILIIHSKDVPRVKEIIQTLTGTEI